MHCANRTRSAARSGPIWAGSTKRAVPIGGSRPATTRTHREERQMLTRVGIVFSAVAALTLGAGSAAAQTNLKWAHVYETSEPFHTESVWAAEEIEKRTDGRYHIDVFP